MLASPVLPDKYAAERPVIFPSPTSFRWFLRSHRDELVQRGAVLMPTGRLLIDPEAFDKAVRDIGARQATLTPRSTARAS